MNLSRVTAYNANRQNSNVFLYAINDQLENDIEIPFTIASEPTKYTGKIEQPMKVLLGSSVVDLGSSSKSLRGFGGGGWCFGLGSQEP